MEMLIYFIFIMVLMSFLFHIVMHLLTIFLPSMTDRAVEAILEDPHRHVRGEHFLYFLRNMTCFAFLLILFIAVYKRNTVPQKKTDNIELVSINKRYGWNN